MRITIIITFLLAFLFVMGCDKQPVQKIVGGSDINWSKISVHGRSSIRIAVLHDKSDDSLLVTYEVAGRHNDNELQPRVHKYSFSIELTDNKGASINDQNNAMITPGTPKIEDFPRACSHCPYRGMIKYKIIRDGEKRYLAKGINELDADISEIYELPSEFKLRVSYRPIPKEYIGNVEVQNYLDDQVVSSWVWLK